MLFFAVLLALLITFHAILLLFGCCAFLSTGKKSIRSMRQIFLLFAVGDWYLLSLSHLSIEQSSGGKEKSSHAEISLQCSLLNPPSPLHITILGAIANELRATVSFSFSMSVSASCSTVCLSIRWEKSWRSQLQSAISLNLRHPFAKGFLLVCLTAVSWVTKCVCQFVHFLWKMNSGIF